MMSHLLAERTSEFFFEWFREQEDLENEARRYDKSIFDIFLLDVSQEALEETIYEGFSLLITIEEESFSEDVLKRHSNLQRKATRTLERWIGNNDYLKTSENTNIIESINHTINILLKIRDIYNQTSDTNAFELEGIDVVRKALQIFLPEFTSFRVRRSPLRMEVNKSGKIITVNQLSDGEKCLIALVGDLARRIAIANPAKENPLEGNSIVLIDEIDLHLHPKWQRNIIPRLTEVFPNCQFIISTHSPHVINHVQPENIFLLDQTPQGIVASHPSKSYGNNADRILEDLMGLETTRPDEIFQELRNIFSLIGSNSLSEAVDKIAELKKKIGSDPEIVKAEVLLARKEIIGK